MKRSIAIGHGLTVLCVFATAQVMCQKTGSEDEEVYQVISENRVPMLTELIASSGLVNASRKLHITPLSKSDLNPTADDGNDNDNDGEQQQQYCQRPSPRVLASLAPEVDNIGTGTKSDWKMSQAKDALPEIDNAKCQSTNDDGQELGYHPRRLNSVSGDLRGRRNMPSNKGPKNSRPAMVVV